MDYKNAGVDIEAGYKAVELMKKHVASTMRNEVLTDIGGFSGAFSLDSFKGMEHPTLVSGTDGNFKIETDVSNYGIYFIVTEKLQFNGNAVSVKIVCN